MGRDDRCDRERVSMDERGEVVRLAGAVENLTQVVEGIGAALEQQR